MSDVCVKCMETVLIGDAPNSIRHVIAEPLCDTLF